jgi:hypothetical protein
MCAVKVQVNEILPIIFSEFDFLLIFSFRKVQHSTGGKMQGRPLTRPLQLLASLNSARRGNFVNYKSQQVLAIKHRRVFSNVGAANTNQKDSP